MAVQDFDLRAVDEALDEQRLTVATGSAELD
jgi:hypothetical protein